jgi:nitrate reductase cytochrome c-type subunit
MLGGMALALVATVAVVLASTWAAGRGTTIPPVKLPTMAATVTPAQVSIIADPLTRLTRSFPQQPPQCLYEADGYHVVGNNFCIATSSPIPDFTVTATATQLSGAADQSYGISFRRVSQGNYYSFEIDGRGNWYLYKAVDGTLTTVAYQYSSPAIHKGATATNTLQVRAAGAHLAFFVNGVSVGVVVDDTYTTGKIGLGGNEGLEIVYRDFSLTRPK